MTLLLANPIDHDVDVPPSDISALPSPDHAAHFREVTWILERLDHLQGQDRNKLRRILLKTSNGRTEEENDYLWSMMREHFH